MNLVPNNHLLLNVPFQSTNFRKKELYVDNKVQETIGDVLCPTCRIEKCVYLSTNKTTSFYDFKKCKDCCRVLNIPFEDQKLTIMLCGDDGTNCFARKTSGDYQKRKTISIFEKISPPIAHNQAHPNLNQKRQNLSNLRHLRIDTPLVDTVNQNFIYFLFIHTFSLH